MGNYANNSIEILDMKRSGGFLKYILRILFAFASGALGFGFLSGIFFSITKGSLEGFVLGLVVGVIWAVLLFVVLLPLDIFEKIKCYRKYGLLDFGVRQKCTFRIDADYDTILDTLQKVFQNQQKMHLRRSDTKRGIIEAEVGRSWRSFGENITVTLDSNQGGKMYVAVSSRPKISTTMIDFSKNFENVQLVIQELKNRLN